MVKQSIALFAVVVTLFAASSVTYARRASVSDDVVPGQYIVVFNDSVSDPSLTAREMGREQGLSISHEYGRALRGFAATIPAERLEAVKRDPRVAFVSEDRMVTASTHSAGFSTPSQPVEKTPFGILRTGANGSTSLGSGVGVAVIDTGIDLKHPDLVGNIASAQKTCITGTRNANDDNGHGTHVAGTIAGVDNTIGVVGVAPQAKLYPVKVLNKNGSGTWSSVICGIDWVTANAQTLGIKVANMSLGGGGASDNNCGNTNNDALHKAICRSVAAGVTYVVAAGNEGANAVNASPASYDDAVITVSALADSDGNAGGLGSATGYGADDTFASFSNYGSPVDIGAPGVGIYSTWKGSAYNTISGTSMATPHVAGAAALYIASHPGASWTEVRSALMNGGEVLGSGHTDPSGRHPEPVLKVGAGW